MENYPLRNEKCSKCHPNHWPRAFYKFCSVTLTLFFPLLVLCYFILVNAALLQDVRKSTLNPALRLMMWSVPLCFHSSWVVVMEKHWMASLHRGNLSHPRPGWPCSPWIQNSEFSDKGQPEGFWPHWVPDICGSTNTLTACEELAQKR